MSFKDLFKDVPADYGTEDNQYFVQEKLSFVTIIAWLFIILSGLRSLILIILFGAIKLKLFFPIAMMSYAQSCLASCLVLSFMMLISSVGLLKRKQWGRLMFITLLTIAIIRDLGDIFFPNLLYTWVVPGLVRTPASERHLLEMYRSAHIFSIVFWSIVPTVFFAWIIKKILSKDIRQEFKQNDYDMRIKILIVILLLISVFFISWGAFYVSERTHYKRVSEITPYKRDCDNGRYDACMQGFFYYANQGNTDRDLVFFKKIVSIKGPNYFRSQCIELKQSESCFFLGKSYQLGVGVTKDLRTATSFYRKACDGGYAPGCINLGFMYMNGYGVNKDYPIAVSLYRKLCNGGNAPGCSSLGLMYVNGYGVGKDYSTAVSLFKKACDGGNAPGCSSLGFMYMNGYGVDKDYLTAVSLFKKACDEGNAFGCSVLGFMYVKGYGVNRDKSMATSLFKEGCNGGDAYGCKALESLF